MNAITDTRLARADLAALDPPVIQRRIGRLMRAYLRTRSADLARSIVRHLEALCGHPRLDAGHEERCVYRRLTRHWRLLAEQGTGGRHALTSATRYG